MFVPNRSTFLDYFGHLESCLSNVKLSFFLSLYWHIFLLLSKAKSFKITRNWTILYEISLQCSTIPVGEEQKHQKTGWQNHRLWTKMGSFTCICVLGSLKHTLTKKTQNPLSVFHPMFVTHGQKKELAFLVSVVYCVCLVS